MINSEALIESLARSFNQLLIEKGMRLDLETMRLVPGIADDAIENPSEFISNVCRASAYTVDDHINRMMNESKENLNNQT